MSQESSHSSSLPTEFAASPLWIQNPEDRSSPSESYPNAFPPTRTTTIPYDRRQFKRHHMPLELVLRPESNGAPLYASAADASAGGCYVEAVFPLARGTRLSVVLWLVSDKVVTKAIVRTSHPGVGMGIEFLGMTATETQRLALFLESHVHDEAISDFALPTLSAR
jgi:hypothetical protein